MAKRKRKLKRCKWQFVSLSLVYGQVNLNG